MDFLALALLLAMIGFFWLTVAWIAWRLVVAVIRAVTREVKDEWESRR